MTSKNKQILVAIIGVVLLIGLGVATLIVIPRLSQTEESIAPTAPESEPAAANDWLGDPACNLTFTITEEATPSATPTNTPTSTPTSTNTPTPTATNTPTATPTSTATCGITCTTDAQCGATGSGMECEITGTATSGLCRRTACLTETDCTCPVPTNTPRPSATPTTATLPDAGIGLPTLGALGGGVVMILLGILLAL